MSSVKQPWCVDIETQTCCQRCGQVVSSEYARVLGDNQGRVHGCRECASFRERNPGSADR